MQINDIKNELESILILFEKHERRAGLSYLGIKLANSKNNKNYNDLNRCQKELSTLRKTFKSQSAKDWAKNLYRSLKNYNECFRPHYNLSTIKNEQSGFYLTDIEVIKYEDNLPNSHEIIKNEDGIPNSNEIIKSEDGIPNSHEIAKNEDIFYNPQKIMKSAREVLEKEQAYKLQDPKFTETSDSIDDLYKKVLLTVDNIKASVHTLSLCDQDTLQVLPQNYNCRNVKNHNLIIRTHTHHENLLIMAEDLQRLNEIFELLSLLNADNTTKKENNDNQRYVVRRLSTGTFELFVTLYLPMATAITGFVFLIIKEIQQSKDRELSLKLKEKELSQSEMKITSQIINDAAKILSVDPKNEVCRKIISQAGALTLTYLQNNLHGSINGEDYRIPETPTLKIEEITLEIENSTDNGEE